MKITSQNSIILFFFLILSSCCYDDDLLRNEREDYLGDNLRIDGFYYYYFEGEIRGVTFFYRNGICLEIVGDGNKRADPEDVKTLLTEENIEYHRKSKEGWGLFKVIGNTFFSEKWNAPMNGVRATVIESGHILNDTSFLITKRDNSISGITDSNRTYFFYPYSPKPDSTNVFIK